MTTYRRDSSDLTSSPDAGSMRVLMMCSEKGWYGGEEHLRLLAEAYRAKGHDTRIVARRGHECEGRMRELGFTVHALPGRWRTPRSLWRLRRLIENFRPNVLHANDAHAVTAMGLASWGLRRRPARLAVRHLDYLIRSPQRYRWWCDGIACTSQQALQACRRSGLEADRLRYIPNGVDPAPVRAADGAAVRRELSQRLNLPDGGVLAICVAQLSAYKGHRFLIAAMPEILRHISGFRLALVGEGDQHLAIREQIHELELESCTALLGYREDVPELLKACDLFTLPSLHETTPLSIIEAMFARLPIVATDIGGTNALLAPLEEDGMTARPVGWLVPPESPDELARAIVQACSDDAERERRAANGAAKAERFYRADAMAGRFEAYCRELVQRVTADDDRR